MELRDALWLTRLSEPLGLAGKIDQAWQRAVTRLLIVRGLSSGLPGVAAELICHELAWSGAAS